MGSTNQRITLRARKAGIKIRFEPAEFLAEKLARQIRQEIDRDILNDLLGAVKP